MKKQFLLIAFLIGCVWLSFVNAAEINSLYEIELPILKEGSSEQSKLLNQGFQSVLVRVSGTENILKSEPIVKAQENTDKYIKRFSYHKRADAQRTIKILFNEKLISELLATTKQPVLEKKRPITLVWLVVEQDKTPKWVGGDSEVDLSKAMEEALNRRGIPLIFPLLDLSDTSKISEQDVVNESLESLEEGAKRYNAEAILIGRIQRVSEVWQAHWTLLIKDSKVSFEVSKSELASLLNETAESLSTKLSQHQSNEMALAHTTSNEEKRPLQKTTLLLSVSGIANAEHYNKVLEHLQGLPLVKEVEVAQIMSEKTIFSVQINSEKAAFVQSLAEGNVLVETINTDFNADPTSQSTPNSMLNYKIAGAL